MARRRMFTAELIDSDRFIEMPIAAQMLYINLSVHADDEGFLSSGKRLSAPYGGEESLQELNRAGFIIRFDSGVLEITDWHLQNTIRKDRSSCTIHQAERKMVTVINGRYVLRDAEDLDDNQMTTICQPSDNQLTTICQPSDNQMTTNCQPFDNHLATQNRIEENRIEKNIIDDSRSDQSSAQTDGGEKAANAAGVLDEDLDKEASMMDNNDSTETKITVPTLADVLRFCVKEHLYNVRPMEFFEYYEAADWKDCEGVPIRDWKALLKACDTNFPDLTQGYIHSKNPGCGVHPGFCKT